jgi:hypothetical protein
MPLSELAFSFPSRLLSRKDYEDLANSWRSHRNLSRLAHQVLYEKRALNKQAWCGRREGR